MVSFVWLVVLCAVLALLVAAGFGLAGRIEKAGGGLLNWLHGGRGGAAPGA